MRDGGQNQLLNVLHDLRPFLTILRRRIGQQFSHIARGDRWKYAKFSDVQHVVGDEVHHVFG